MSVHDRTRSRASKPIFARFERLLRRSYRPGAHFQQIEFVACHRWFPTIGRKECNVPVYIAGRFEASASARGGDVFNPSTGRVQARVPLCTPEEVDRAVQAAAAALPAWSETPAVERARVMFRFRERLQGRFEELAALVTREHGKTHLRGPRRNAARDRDGRVCLRNSQSVDGAGAGESCAARRLRDEPASRGSVRRHHAVQLSLDGAAVDVSRGASTCGNTFVLKPSEKVPLSAMKFAELLSRIGPARGRVQHRPRRQDRG